MEFSLLTYNTLFNKGIEGLKKIINNYQPDIICLQEVNTDESNLAKIEKLNYKLADFSNSIIKLGKIFGLATFYNEKKFYLNDSQKIPIIQSLFNQILPLFKITQAKNINPNFLKTVLIYKQSKRKLIIYNTHLPVLGSNSVKIKQLKQALAEVDINQKNSTIFAGDFNYLPYGRKNLEKLMKGFGFKEATKNIDYTIKYEGNLKKLHYNFISRVIVKTFSKFFTNKLKIDYIFYRNLILKETKRINIFHSDHFPVISTFYLLK